MKKGGDNWVALDKEVTGSERQVLLNLEPSAAYHIRIQGKNSIDTGAWSEEKIARTLADDMTYEPKITLKASTSQSLSMAWNPPPEPIWDYVQYYELKATPLGTLAGDLFRVHEVKNGKETQYMWTHLNLGTTYQFQVRSHNLQLFPKGKQEKEENAYLLHVL